MRRAFLAILLVAACKPAPPSDSQKPLYEATRLVSNLSPVADSVHTGQLDVGGGQVALPLTFRWTVGRDDTDCLRISSLRVERAGGDSAITIRDVKHATAPCGMFFESNDTIRFEPITLSLSYSGEAGGKHHEFQGSVAILTGSGILEPTR